MNDVVNHPEHYQGKVECIDCLEAATEGLTASRQCVLRMRLSTCIAGKGKTARRTC